MADQSSSERGRRAEELAVGWLERQGYQVLARNQATRQGEVDLVCQEGETLCFVEVRSRRAGAVVPAAESVSRAKMRRVVSAATAWAMSHGGLERPIRFDLLSVTMCDAGPSFELIRNAFDGSGEPSL